jgi:hypothetical protein
MEMAHENDRALLSLRNWREADKKRLGVKGQSPEQIRKADRALNCAVVELRTAADSVEKLSEQIEVTSSNFK